MSEYLPFNTNGSMGSHPIPEEIHNKIGSILQDWLIKEGFPIEEDTMLLYIEGHCITEKNRR